MLQSLQLDRHRGIMLDEESKKMFTYKYLNSDDLNALIKKYKSSRNKERKLALRDEIFSNVARFIWKSINKSSSIRLQDREEVFNASVLDFYKCLNHYEVNRGLNFTTYLSFWIKKSIQDFNYSSNIVKIAKGSFTSASEKLRNRASLSSNSSLVYVDKPVIVGGDFVDSVKHIEDYKAMENIFSGIEQKDFIDFVKNNLNERQFIVIKYRYLIEDTWTFEDFKPVLHVGKEVIRQIEGHALFKLRKIITNKQHFETNIYDLKPPIGSHIPTEQELEENHEKIMKRKHEMRQKFIKK